MPASELFTSWKEIAGYLGKGVRTVQRWERELGLPVRRPIGSGKHVVIAVRADLDAWMSRGFAERSSRKASGTFQYRVLLVDDDEQFRTVTKAVLESKGYEVVPAEDGFAGLATLKLALPDIIISDLRMPNMNGFEFLSIVRRRFAHLPVIAISGEYAAIDLPPSVLSDAYLQKGSYAPADLLNTVTALLDQTPMRSRESKKLKAPVWIPMPTAGSTYVVVTCPECLRTFPTLKTQEIAPGSYEELCDHCATKVRFEIGKPHVELAKAATAPDAEKRPANRSIRNT